jgi:hypothetical protein
MTEAAVTILDDERLIRDGEAAVDLYNKDLKNARARIMPMARGLLAAKRKYPATQDFGDWLHTSSYREIGDTDRAALIKIGEQDEFASKFVRTTNLISPRAIWDAITELQSTSRLGNSTAAVTSIVEQPEIAIDSTEKPQSPLHAETPELGIARVEVSHRSPLHDVPRVKEVYAIFSQANTRGTLNALKGKRAFAPIWQLILTALDAGMLQPTHTKITEPNLRFLFPLGSGRYCGKFDLTDTKTREHVRDIMLPAMIACRDNLLAAPERMREILNEYERGRSTQQQQAVIAEKRSVAVKSLPVTEQELMMFGQTVWPRLGINQGEYTYDQVRAAIWTFRDYESWNQMATEDTGSHALRIRNSLRYLGEYLQRTDRNNPMAKIFSLILWFSHLMEKSPNGECKWPMYPHVEGQW